jgi:hypothetical protein
MVKMSQLGFCWLAGRTKPNIDMLQAVRNLMMNHRALH